MSTTTRPILTITEDHQLSPVCKRMYDKALGKVRDQVIAGTLTPADWQDAQADILLYLSQTFGARMWA